MKFVVAALAVLGVVLAVPFKNVNEQEEVALAMIKCVVKALNGGLPSANIPDHDPLHIPRTFTIPIDLVSLVTGNVTVHDMQLQDIVVFDITNVTGVKTDNGLNYTYEFYWKNMAFVGQWEGKIKTFLGESDRNGTVTINFWDMIFKGVWDMTVPSGDVKESLDSFLVTPTVSQAEVIIKGLGNSIIDGLVNVAVTPILTTAINLAFPSELASGLLQKRFNDLWIGNASRIDAVLENCKGGKTLLY